MVEPPFSCPPFKGNRPGLQPLRRVYRSVPAQRRGPNSALQVSLVLVLRLNGSESPWDQPSDWLVKPCGRGLDQILGFMLLYL